MKDMYKIVVKLNFHLLLSDEYKKLHNQALALFPKPDEDEKLAPEIPLFEGTRKALDDLTIFPNKD